MKAQNTDSLLFSSTEADLDVNAKKLGAVELGYNNVNRPNKFCC
jgi:hypothetical protein